MRKLTKRRAPRRSLASSRRRVAFTRKSFRKGFKPRSSIKRPRYSRFKKTVGKIRRSATVGQSFIRKVREAVLSKNVFDKTQSVTYTGASGQAMYNDLEPVLYEKAHLQYVNAATPTINSGLGGLIADSPITNKFTVHDNRITYSITNNSTSFCDTTAYYCQPRRDITGSAYATPSSAVIQGFTDENSGALTVSPSQMPFQSQLFTTWWKVTKTRKMRIGPGETITLVLHHAIPRTINMEHISPRNNATEILAFQMQRWIMLRTLGGPCVDSTNGAVTTYSKPALGVIIRTQLEWSQTPTYNKSVKVFNSVATVADANQQHVSTGYNGVFPISYAQ